MAISTFLCVYSEANGMLHVQCKIVYLVCAGVTDHFLLSFLDRWKHKGLPLL